MSGRRATFLDAGVFLVAFRLEDATAGKALRLFEDAARDFVSSDLVRLETIPQATYHKRGDEIEFYETCFARVSLWVPVDAQLVKQASELACRYGLHAMDAMHVAAAITGHAEQFITTERRTKPLHRVAELEVVSLDSLS